MADKPILNPFMSDSYINEQTSTGAKLLDKQRNGSPRFSFPDVAASSSARDILLNALLGLGQGAEGAAAINKLGDPTASFLSGISAGIAGPKMNDIRAARAKAEAESQMAQLEAMPLTAEQFPSIAEKHPELIGIPLGMVNKFSGILGNYDKIEQALQLLMIREGGLNNRAGNAETQKRKAAIEKQAGGVNGVVLKATNPELYNQLEEEYKKITGSKLNKPKENKSQFNKIRVRLSNGATGTILESEFDGKSMTKL